MYAVIIPHYNSVSSLERLIDSIPKKMDIEILIIDDGSSREEKKKLISFIESRKEKYIIKLFDNTSGFKGAGAARNIGINNSNAKWLIFADADDYFCENSFNILDKYKDKSYDIIFFPPTSIDMSNGKISNRHDNYANLINNYFLDEKNCTLFLRTRFLVPWSKMYKSEFISKKNLYFENVLVSNDIMFSAKSGLSAKNLAVSSEEIYCVTKSSNTLTTKISKKNFEIRLEVFVRYYTYLKNELDSQDFKKLGLSIVSNTMIAFKDFGVVYAVKTAYYLKKKGVKSFSKKSISVKKIQKFWGK